MTTTSTDSTRPAGAPTRVAVVCAGFIADFHIEILQGTPGVELVSICDLDLGRAQLAAAKWKIPHAVGAISALADLKIDIAHVLVPPNLQGIGHIGERGRWLVAELRRQPDRRRSQRRLASS